MQQLEQLEQIISPFLIITLGVLPSIIWLSFYLKKDNNPEPRTMILFIFFLGVLSAFAAVFIELYLLKFFDFFPMGTITATFLEIFVAIVLVEEFFKYSVVRFTILKNPEFDEPVDAMLYLIIAALGFAAAENTLLFFTLDSFGDIAFIGVMRFWGATFLHTLTSGIVGYYLATSICSRTQHHKMVLIKGMVLAVMIHGIFNYILFLENAYMLIIIPIIMIASAFFVFRQIRILKNKVAICDMHMQ